MPLSTHSFCPVPLLSNVSPKMKSLARLVVAAVVQQKRAPSERGDGTVRAPLETKKNGRGRGAKSCVLLESAVSSHRGGV